MPPVAGAGGLLRRRRLASPPAHCCSRLPPCCQAAGVNWLESYQAPPLKQQPGSRPRLTPTFRRIPPRETAVALRRARLTSPAAAAMILRLTPLLRRPAGVLLLLVLLAAPAAADFSTDWKPARATHYSAPGDTWTIHDGSCTHQYIWPDVGTGAPARLRGRRHGCSIRRTNTASCCCARQTLTDGSCFLLAACPPPLLAPATQAGTRARCRTRTQTSSAPAGGPAGRAAGQGSARAGTIIVPAVGRLASGTRERPAPCPPCPRPAPQALLRDPLRPAQVHRRLRRAAGPLHRCVLRPAGLGGGHHRGALGGGLEGCRRCRSARRDAAAAEPPAPCALACPPPAHHLPTRLTPPAALLCRCALPLMPTECLRVSHHPAPQDACPCQYPGARCRCLVGAQSVSAPLPVPSA